MNRLVQLIRARLLLEELTARPGTGTMTSTRPDFDPHPTLGRLERHRVQRRDHRGVATVTHSPPETTDGVDITPNPC